MSGRATTTVGSPSRSAGTGLAVEVVLGDEDLPPALRAALRELLVAVAGDLERLACEYPELASRLLARALPLRREVGSEQ